MDLARIHHIALICSDKTAALDFYHNKLGFQILRENYRKDRDDWKIDLKFHDCELELFIMKDHPKHLFPEAYGLRHLAFQVEDIEKTISELEAEGIRCEPIRRDAFTGRKMTFFHDPDGQPLEIRE